MIGESIYKALNPKAKSDQSASVRNHGRSKKLNERRNTFLVHRFYFKSKIQRKFYPEVIEELSEELHLSKMTVQKILVDKSDEILQLKKEAISVTKLRKLWSCWVWEVKESQLLKGRLNAA